MQRVDELCLRRLARARDAKPRAARRVLVFQKKKRAGRPFYFKRAMISSTSDSLAWGNLYSINRPGSTHWAFWHSISLGSPLM